MTDEPIRQAGESVIIRVHAQPGAKHTALAGLHGTAVKLKVQAPPVEGAANEAAIKFLARSLGVAKSKVALVRGHKSRAKTFEVRGVRLADAHRKLLEG